MKKLSQIIKENIGAPHLANHRTPVANIIQTLKAFTARMGVVIEPVGDYGLSIKSTKFNTKEGLDAVMNRSYFDDRAINRLTIASYVWQCGLTPYIVAVSPSQVDVICQPNDTGLAAPGIELSQYLFVPEA